jgi:hypothetical protein
VFISVHLWFIIHHSTFFIRRDPWLKLENFPPKNRPFTPILFTSRFSKATCKYFNYFGPWTAFVQGPPLYSSMMNVIKTPLNDRPVPSPALAGRRVPPLVAPSSSPARCGIVTPPLALNSKSTHRDAVPPKAQLVAPKPSSDGGSPKPSLRPKLQVSRTFFPAPRPLAPQSLQTPSKEGFNKLTN